MNYINIGGRTTVNPQEVIIFQADINYTIVHYANGSKAVVATPLKTIEARFAPYEFYRSHKSYMINLQYIKYVHSVENTVHMIDNKIAMVSRRKLLQLKQYLNNR